MDNFITSLANPKIKKVVELHQKKGRKQQGLYIIEGFHLIEEAIKHDVEFVSLFIEEGCSAPDVECEVYGVTADVMKKIATTKTPQPILAVLKKVELSMCESNQVLYLDDLQDPGNMGTILRTSVAFGVKHVILSPQCVDLFDSKVLRSAQGAHFQMTYDICSETTLDAKYPEYQKIVTTLDDAISLDSFQPKDKWMLIVGNEGSGVKPSLQAMSDAKIKIDASGMESLNVAVATSICLYKLTR